MKSKIWHIWDFPEDNVRVKFKNNKKFLEESIKYFCSIKNMANFLSVKSSTIHGWRQYNLFIPLKYIKKIVKFRRLDRYNLEKEIVAYKGSNLSLVINNPRLPLKESPELFAIITHLIGDGCVNKNGIPVYTNSCKELIDNFNKLIRKVFGNIGYKIYKREKDNNYNYRTSKIIAEILEHFYRGINFDSLTAKFPSKTFKLSKKHYIGIIRAIVDDEGHIRDNGISIKMKNKYLIKQIALMLVKIFGENSIYYVNTKDGMHEVDLRAKYLQLFQKKIKLVHPKKQQDLIYAVTKATYRNKKHRGNIWETKMKILKILKCSDSNIKELSKELFINKSNLCNHLSDMEIISFVKRLNFDNNSSYTITKKGLSFLQDNEFRKTRKKPRINKLYYNILNNKKTLISLKENTRNRLFWLLMRLYGSNSKIGKKLKVHSNTISGWKNGKHRIPAKVLNTFIISLGEKGLDLTKEVNNNIEEIKTINERNSL